MSSNIKLTRFASTDDLIPPALRSAWPVAILAQGTAMDDAIFVYQVGKSDDPIPGDKFECVASVNQMFELPKTQGVSLTTETGIPFYRTNVLQFVARSASEAERIWVDVVQEVQLLVANYNSALTLKGTDFAEIDTTGFVISPFTMTPPSRVQITSHPAGTVAVSGLVQSIVTPDTTLVGWLPVSALGPSVVKPPGAAFFYNLALDPNLKAIWPPLQPFGGNQLHRNGLLMPYGTVWELTQDTIWWLDFNPTLIPGYQRTSPGAADGNAPWPIDYVSAASPGAVQNILTITLFK